MYERRGGGREIEKGRRGKLRLIKVPGFVQRKLRPRTVRRKNEEESSTCSWQLDLSFHTKKI